MKNLKNIWFILCCLSYTSLSSAMVNEAYQEIPTIVGSWLAGDMVNTIGKDFGKWATNNVFFFKGLTGKVVALDLKFFFNAVVKHFLIEQGFETLTDDKLASTTAYGSGIKYISAQELYLLLKRAWLSWEKIHTKSDIIPPTVNPLINLQANNTVANSTATTLSGHEKFLEQHNLTTAGHDISYFVYDYVNNRLVWISNIPSTTKTIAYSLASDIPGFSIEILYYLVSYYTTVLTQSLSNHFINPLVSYSGYTQLKKEPLNTMIKASVGIVISEYIMLFHTMPKLQYLLEKLHLYDSEREEIHLTMYKAGIKTPFALEFLKKGYATLSNLKIVPTLVTAALLKYIDYKYLIKHKDHQD